MADIAQIGFAADTSGLTKAQTELKKIPPAAVEAANAADAAATAIEGAGEAAEAAAGGIAAIKPAVDKASGALGKASATGKTFSKTNKDIQNDTRATTKVIKDQGDNVIDATDKFTKGGKKASDSVAGVSWQAKNLSFQLVDVTQGLASGVPVFQIFAQQAGQIGQAIASGPNGLGGLLKELGSSIMRMLTPVRLLAGALVLLGIAAFSIVSSVTKSTLALDDLSKATDVSIAKLHALQQASAIKGINSDEFADGMKSFALSVNDAQHNMGSLNGLLGSSAKGAKTLEDYLERVADKVASASSGIQKIKILQEANLPSSAAWVRFMDQGAAGIRAAAAATVQFNSAAEENMIAKARAFDEKWNGAISSVKESFKSFTVDAINWIDKLSTAVVAAAAGVGAALAIAIAPFSLIVAGLVAIAAAITAGIAAIKGSAGAGSDPGEFNGTRITVTPKDDPRRKSKASDDLTKEQKLAAIALAQQRISVLGELATTEDLVKQKELELAAAGLNGVGVNKQQYDAIMNVVRATNDNNRVQAQAAAGIFNLASANKAAQETFQMWVDKKLIDPTNVEQVAAAQLVLARNIKATSDAAAVAAAPLQGLKQLELDSTNFTKVIDQGAVGALNNLGSALVDITSGTTSVADGFKNMASIVLRAIQEMIVKLLIIGPLAKSLQSVFSPLSSGIGTTATVVPSALGNVFGAANDNVSKYAKGGTFANTIVKKPTMFAFANGGSNLGIMGEAGPEAVMPLQRGPDGSLGVQMYGQASGSNDNSMHVSYAPVYQIGGKVSQEDLDELRKAQRDEQRNFTSRVAQANRQLGKRGY